MTSHPGYRVAIFDAAGTPEFEVAGAGVETVLFSVVTEGDEFAWCLEPLGTVGPFDAIVEVTETQPIPPVTFEALGPRPVDAAANTNAPLAGRLHLTFAYGVPPPGFRSSPEHPPALLYAGGRYVALAMGLSPDGGVAHALVGFLAP